MEKYANNLEELVAQRTVELVDEKKKTETLLYRMLPRWVTLVVNLNGANTEAIVECDIQDLSIIRPYLILEKLTDACFAVWTYHSDVIWASWQIQFPTTRLFVKLGLNTNNK